MILFDDEPCPCRSLAPGMYAIAPSCSRHYDARNPTHLSCICADVANVDCLCCDENERRGLARTGLEKMGSAKQQIGSFDAATRNAAAHNAGPPGGFPTTVACDARLPARWPLILSLATCQQRSRR